MWTKHFASSVADSTFTIHEAADNDATFNSTYSVVGSLNSFNSRTTKRTRRENLAPEEPIDLNLDVSVTLKEREM